ncbi:hypothetical protein JTE90_012954 [Oedothorax gibbosus]|uniref:HIT-type domain-containing protein n=1 Tax=Oedothorax gibbosus TaxID=931172 RepID=A0AAV6TWL9_9ARAC|nr:hypothetical protein JTE90_012954 [Oedothorax gibbosus]
MSLSKVAPSCVFCKSGSGIYTCPRCSKKYCSSYCYKCRAHADCSEAFYKSWVEESLQAKSCDPTDRENMLRILKEFEAASVEDAEDDCEPSMEERFASLNIDKAGEDVIWQHLSQEEKANFKAFIENEKNIEAIVSIKRHWWTKKTLSLVTDDESSASIVEDDVAPRPPYPLSTKKLSELTSATPSNCIQNNLVNVLYSYAYLCRLYNGDLRDFLGEVVDLLFTLSPVLSEGYNYSSLEESLQDSIRKIMESDSKNPVGYVKSIVTDIEAILQGPTNGKASTFVLCALHDIKLLFLELKDEYKDKSKHDKSLKRRLLLVVKKIEYFMSWSLEYEETLKNISSDILLVMLPDLIPESDQPVDKKVVSKTKKKPLIAEIN